MFVVQALDYDSARSKLRKTIEKPSEDPTKLPKVWALLALSLVITYGRSRLNKNTTTPKMSLTS